MRLRNKERYRSSKKGGDLIKLADNKLLVEPKKYLVSVRREHRQVIGYSMVTAAKALGKSIIQLRVWVNKGLIPEPVLPVIKCGYHIYDKRELNIIRKHLYRHTKKGNSYLTNKSINFIADLSKEVEDYRGEKYGI